MQIDPIELRAAFQAQTRAAAFHLFDPNVSLIDIGLRIKEQESRRVTTEPTVRVHLRRKPRGAAFEAFAGHYPERVIDERRIGFPLDIVEGDYQLQWYWFMPRQPPIRGQVFSLLQGGISISNAESFGFGTLGGLVKDRDTGDTMLLSNWHVLVGSAYAHPGLRIYQPGYGDGGRFQHTIARFERHGMNDGIDAAVAGLTGTRSWMNNQLDIGPVSGVAPPISGMHVIKSGRTSGVTEGVITGIGGLAKIPYGGFERVVRQIVHITQTPEKGEVSAPGDSGSWWLDKNTHKAVGLHFAGDNLPEYGLAIAMPQVLDALNVDIVTETESITVAPARRMEPVRV